MSLTKYQQKRNFSNTTEPKNIKKTSSGSLSFVVQRHHATNLHYDFRLEIDGVLKSWAIPKGPSLNPKDKRLAMMVEDHPVDYKNFEGEIPKGNYGAGTVFIFDEGSYESLNSDRKKDEKEIRNGLKSGSLKIKLNGKILKGEFALVKIKNSEQNAWLLIKHSDEFALTRFSLEDLIPQKIKKEGTDFKKKTAKQEITTENIDLHEAEKSKIFSPMLAKLANHIFDDPEWVFERKLDGYRIIASIEKDVKLITRNGKDYTENYLKIKNELKKIKQNVVIDGEIVVEDKKGKDDFQMLQHYENEQVKVNIKYYVFDLLYMDGYELFHLSLIKRKELLKKLLAPYQSKLLIYHDHTGEKGSELLKIASKNNWEGVIAKMKDGEYLPGKRTDTWLKFKQSNSQEAVICGYTQPAGSRRHFGALILGLYNQKHQLTYIGNCGTGFNDKLLVSLFNLMKERISIKRPFKEQTNNEQNPTWVRPELICEVNYTEWTMDGHLRHPVFKGLRDDKDVEMIAKETASTMTKNSKSETKKRDEDKVEDGKIIRIDRKELKLTNLQKLYWAKEKITKEALINYYESVADFMLPYLKDKPLSLNRHPNGAGEPGFYQKDVNTDQIPKWAKTAKIHSESNDKEIDYLVCNDKATLLYMANLGCIEINPWLSSFKKPNNPDFMVIDLDPDKNKFFEVVEIALIVKKILDNLKIISFVKTSGSSGIHIYVYVAGKYDYDFVKNFANFIAQQVHEESPDDTSLERSPVKRKNKIYIDYLQNRRGQTIAAPYSARPKPGATVSMPLNWNDLNKDLDMKNYTIKNVFAIIKEREDPWKDIFEVKADLKKALSMFRK